MSLENLLKTNSEHLIARYLDFDDLYNLILVCKLTNTRVFIKKHMDEVKNIYRIFANSAIFTNYMQLGKNIQDIEKQIHEFEILIPLNSNIFKLIDNIHFSKKEIYKFILIRHLIQIREKIRIMEKFIGCSLSEKLHINLLGTTLHFSLIFNNFKVKHKTDGVHFSHRDKIPKFYDTETGIKIRNYGGEFPENIKKLFIFFYTTKINGYIGYFKYFNVDVFGRMFKHLCSHCFASLKKKYNKKMYCGNCKLKKAK